MEDHRNLRSILSLLVGLLFLGSGLCQADVTYSFSGIVSSLEDNEYPAFGEQFKDDALFLQSVTLHSPVSGRITLGDGVPSNASNIDYGELEGVEGYNNSVVALQGRVGEELLFELSGSFVPSPNEISSLAFIYDNAIPELLIDTGNDPLDGVVLAAHLGAKLFGKSYHGSFGIALLSSNTTLLSSAELPVLIPSLENFDQNQLAFVEIDGFSKIVGIELTSFAVVPEPRACLFLSSLVIAVCSFRVRSSYLS